MTYCRRFFLFFPTQSIIRCPTFGHRYQLRKKTFCFQLDLSRQYLHGIGRMLGTIDTPMPTRPEFPQISFHMPGNQRSPESNQQLRTIFLPLCLFYRCQYPVDRSDMPLRSHIGQRFCQYHYIRITRQPMKRFSQPEIRPMKSGQNHHLRTMIEDIHQTLHHPGRQTRGRIDTFDRPYFPLRVIPQPIERFPQGYIQMYRSLPAFQSGIQSIVDQTIGIPVFVCMEQFGR